jgi:hypothetical protein
VVARGWGRRKRDGEEPIVAAADTVDLTGDEHAWWADRDSLMGGVPAGGQGSSRTKGRRDDEPDDATHSAFEDYFSSESLFRGPKPDDKRSPSDDPYGALGLKETATWAEITAAHRRLAKQHHPDTLTDAQPDQRARSEAFIRDLNIAYMELRRRRGR